MRQFQGVGIALALLSLSLPAAGENPGLEGPYLSASPELDVRGGGATQQPPYVGDVQLNFAGEIPPDWYAAYPSWVGGGSAHWELFAETVDKTQGESALRVTLRDENVFVRDIYLGTKLRVRTGVPTTITFDAKLSNMSTRAQYAVRLDASLAGDDMVDIEDFGGHERPDTVLIPAELFGDGDWHTFFKEVVPTGPEVSLIIYLRGGAAGDPGAPHVGKFHLIDNVTVTPPPLPPCGELYADRDVDGDVDQEDFGVFQICYTGVGVFELSGECACFNRDGDSDVDQADFGAFQLCVSGPDLLADPDCQQAG